MLKKSRDFFGQTNSEVGNFLGIKYEPLSDPPVIKICEWGPWGTILAQNTVPVEARYEVGHVIYERSVYDADLECR